MAEQQQAGGLPEGWRETTLGTHIDVKHGFAFKGESFVEKPNENVLLTPGNFSIGGGLAVSNSKCNTP